MLSKLLLINIRTLIMARLFIATILLCLGFWRYGQHRSLFLGLVVFLSIMSLIYILWFIFAKKISLLLYMQIAIDLIWESYLIHQTGGVYSIFIVFYVLTVLSAFFVLPYNSSFWISVIASVIFVSLVTFEFLSFRIPVVNINHQALYSVQEWFSVFYITIIYTVLFFVIGYFGVYFSSKINRLESKIRNQEHLSMLGQITANIAHEIKNPLTAISGSIEVLKKDLDVKLSDEDQELMQCILKESKRVKELLTSILDYSGNEQTQHQKFDIVQTVDDILPVIQNMSPDNGRISVEKIFSKTPLFFHGDANRVKQMLHNLIMNAFEAVGEDGKICIQAEYDKHDLVIQIKDNGKGIPEKIKKHIFHPFQSTKKSGAGLGLALVYKIIQAHNGTISYKTKDQSGSCFTINLPEYIG